MEPYYLPTYLPSLTSAIRPSYATPIIVVRTDTQFAWVGGIHEILVTGCALAAAVWAIALRICVKVSKKGQSKNLVRLLAPLSLNIFPDI